MTAQAGARRRAPGFRRRGATRRDRLLGLLGLLWLLDGIVQLSPSHFDPLFFGTMLRMNMAEPPLWLWNLESAIEPAVTSHAVLANALSAAIELAIGLGLLSRRTAKLALALSLPWALATWLFGESAGGLFGPGASALIGAPGAGLLYAVVALVLWPGRGAEGPAELRGLAMAGGPAGVAGAGSGGLAGAAGAGSGGAARRRGEVAAALGDLAWVALWAGTAALESDALNRVATTPGSEIASAGLGEPAPLAALNRFFGDLVGNNGLEFAIVAAVVQAVIGVTILWPPARRAALAAGIAVGLFYGIVGQDLGGILASGPLGLVESGATDPGTGPIIAVLALALWPVAPSGGCSGRLDPAPSPRAATAG